MKALIRTAAIIFGVIVFSAVFVSAGELTIPNSFTANTPAVADQVNANFAATKTAVDDNNSRLETVEASKQNRITDTCPDGQSIRGINVDGTVDCEPISPAVVKYININCYGVGFTTYGNPSFTYGYSDSGAILIPEEGGSINLTFNVPPDYISGTDVLLELIWHPQTEGSGAVHWRTNWGTLLSPGGAVNDFSGPDPEVTAVSSASTTYITVFHLNSSIELSPGDAVAYGFFRPNDVVVDTYSGGVVIGGIRIAYTGSN